MLLLGLVGSNLGALLLFFVSDIHDFETGFVLEVGLLGLRFDLLPHTSSFRVSLVLDARLLRTFLGKSLLLLSFAEETLFSLWHCVLHLGLAYVCCHPKDLIMSIPRHLLNRRQTLIVVVRLVSWFFAHAILPSLHSGLKWSYLLLDSFKFFLLFLSPLSGGTYPLKLYLILAFALFSLDLLKISLCDLFLLPLGEFSCFLRSPFIFLLALLLLSLSSLS